MAQKIYLLEDNGRLAEMCETAYDSETLLQELLAKYPDLLAGDQMTEAAPRRWLLVSRECGVPDENEVADRWSIDHLFLDQDAVPTLVEVKRSSDTRLRREVVGQMLDYAANAVKYWPVTRIRTTFETMCEKSGFDSEASVRGLLRAEVGDTQAVEAYWQRVDTNLRAGKLRLVFVADEIPLELKRIVEFLNEQMEADVLAVEVRQFTGKDRTTLVPKVIGLTAAAQSKGVAAGALKRTSPWTAEELLTRIRTRDHQGEVDAARRVIEWGRSRELAVLGGTGPKAASLYFGLRTAVGQITKPFYLYDSDVRCMLYLEFAAMGPAFVGRERREELARRLNEKTGVEIDPAKDYPGVRLDAINDSSKLSGLLDVLDWVVESIRSTHA